MTIYDAPWRDLHRIYWASFGRRHQAKAASSSIKRCLNPACFVDKLIDMGAQIILCDPQSDGDRPWKESPNWEAFQMSSPDIRAGVSLLIAALSARSESIIFNINQIDRGYQNIDGRLNALGAQIERIEL